MVRLQRKHDHWHDWQQDNHALFWNKSLAKRKPTSDWVMHPQFALSVWSKTFHVLLFPCSSFGLMGGLICLHSWSLMRFKTMRILLVRTKFVNVELTWRFQPRERSCQDSRTDWKTDHNRRTNDGSDILPLSVVRLRLIWQGERYVCGMFGSWFLISFFPT